MTSTPQTLHELLISFTKETPILDPPPVVPGCAGTTRAYPIRAIANNRNISEKEHELDSAWHVYASPKKRLVKNLSIYNGSDLHD